MESEFATYFAALSDKVNVSASKINESLVSINDGEPVSGYQLKSVMTALVDVLETQASVFRSMSGVLGYVCNSVVNLRADNKSLYMNATNVSGATVPGSALASNIQVSAPQYMNVMPSAASVSSTSGVKRKSRAQLAKERARGSGEAHPDDRSVTSQSVGERSRGGDGDDSVSISSINTQTINDFITSSRIASTGLDSSPLPGDARIQEVIDADRAGRRLNSTQKAILKKYQDSLVSHTHRGAIESKSCESVPHASPTMSPMSLDNKLRSTEESFMDNTGTGVDSIEIKLKRVNLRDEKEEAYASLFKGIDKKMLSRDNKRFEKEGTSGKESMGALALIAKSMETGSYS